MPKRKHTSEEIINKLREAEVVISSGSTVVEAVRRIGVSEQTFYRWRTECGGLRIDRARRLKQLETENSRLKRAVAELTLDNQDTPTRYSRRPPRETSEPRPPPAMRPTRPVGLGDIGAAGLQGAGTAPLDSAP